MSGPGERAAPAPERGCSIEAGWALVERDGGQELLRDATIVVRDGEIAEVVAGHRGGCDRRLDARGLLVLPGFISGHAHAAISSPARGLIESGRFYDRPLLLVDELDDDELDVLTAYNVFELLRSGATTTVEMSGSLRQAESYARVARRWGVRTYLSAIVPSSERLFEIWYRDDDRVLRDSVSGTLAEIERALAFGRRVNGSEDGRIRAQMGPHATDTHTPETMAAILAGARELGNGIHIHLAQRPREVEAVERMWGMRPAAWLEQLGILSEPLLAAHLLAADPAVDFPILARHGVTFSHCPAMAGLLHGAAQPWPEALAAGLNVSLGTDQLCNDCVENLKLATVHGQIRHAQLAAGAAVPLARPTIRDAVAAATRGGADGLRRPDLGRIAPGAKADLVAIDVSGPLVGTGSLPPDPLNNLLYANGLSVRHAMCDGRFTVRDGALAVDDEARVVRAGAALAERMWARLRADGWFEAPPPANSRG